MHSAVEDNSGGQGEFLIRGRAVEITDTESRKEAFEQARNMGYSPQERHILFELRIAEVLATVYEGDRPKRTRWKVDQGGPQAP